MDTVGEKCASMDRMAVIAAPLMTSPTLFLSKKAPMSAAAAVSSIPSCVQKRRHVGRLIAPLDTNTRVV